MLAVIGLDIAKRFFQLHSVDPETGEITKLKLKRAEMLPFSERVEAIERKLDAFRRSDERCERLIDVPGVGLLTATSIVAAVGDAKEFRSGREFAAWLGVVPRHSGTGGHVRILNISKQGNSYLRTMVIHCARAVMARQKEPSPWLQRLMRERPWNVAVVALANKLARTIWALLAHGRHYVPEPRQAAA